MSLLLHLSDLHLANTPQEDAVGDYKVEAVPERDRVTRLRVLRSTLKALSSWLADHDEALDGIIITGDITTRGLPAGFAELPGLLETLGDALPEPARIVVVPGNHDVAWGTRPGSADHYRAFIEGVRSAGYVTPLLDGVDFDGDQPRDIAGPLLICHDFAVVAVNSADMCGAIEPFTLEIEAELERLSTDGKISEGLQGAIRRVRMYDMPRVSPRQMAALASRLDQVPSGLVRVAALHHHLAPVREEEEVKPFESIVNLGAFSAFLSDAQIDVIVHGHKHADQVQTVPLSGGAGDQRFAVVASCGWIGGMAGTGREIAKLLRIDSALPTLRRVEILTVPAVGAGRKLPSRIKRVYSGPTWRPSSTNLLRTISGTTAGNVHEQLLEIARHAEGQPVRDLICVIDQGPTALGPPDTYPPLPGSAAVSDWFNDIVDWWQDPRRAEGKPFTHGQRLRNWPSDQARDQIDAIIEILDRDTATSRGIAVLVNPDTDNVADKTIDFPSFSLLHLWIDDGALHCSAFFRKQEMTYWWAVNAAEIARIQGHVLQALRSAHQGLTAGAIRTHASEAVFSDRVPKVNVPRVDRQFWHDSDSLRVLAVAVADPHMPGRDDDIAALLSLMDEWVPQGGEPPTDGAPVPTCGLAALADMLAALARRYPDSPAREVGDILREMDEANVLYLDQRDTGDPSRRYSRWRGSQTRRLTRIRELLAPQTAQPRHVPAPR